MKRVFLLFIGFLFFALRSPSGRGNETDALSSKEIFPKNLLSPNLVNFFFGGGSIVCSLVRPVLEKRRHRWVSFFFFFFWKLPSDISEEIYVFGVLLCVARCKNKCLSLRLFTLECGRRRGGVLKKKKRHPSGGVLIFQLMS